MARLIVVTSEGEHTHELAPGKPVTIGRDAANDLPFPAETKASRRHCRVAPLPAGGWEVADLGSTNGTRVNGAEVEHRALSTGDVIEVGAVRIRFEDPAEAERLRAAGAQGICFLEWVTAEKKGERVMLNAARTTLGRRETNTIPLADKMASGHHAEIVKDLNGYTIRDLGSTNGTLVNGQPTSEATLVHGARIRVGNSKFVFKDPSMKDIEVELSQFDEDAGWGMMGEIDLSRARGGKAGILAVLALFAAAGAGMWFLSQQAPPPTSGEAATGNRIENGSFEEEDILWIPEQESLADVKRVPAAGKGFALSLAHTGGEDTAPLLVSYVSDLDRIGRRPFRIRAKMRPQGGEADLVVVWESRPERDEMRAGVVPLSETVVLPASAAGAIDATVVPPSWCQAGRLAVRLAPGARATLDDVSVERGSTDGRQPVLEGADPLRPLTIDSEGQAALVSTRTVLFVGGTPIARVAGAPEVLWFRPEEVPEAAEDKALALRGTFTAGERSLPGSVRWSATEEGFRAEVSCEGAASVGLSTDLVAAHLGGAVNVLGAFAPQPLPAVPGQRLEGVAKVLAGDAEPSGARPPVLVAFLPAAGRPEGTVEIVPSSDPGLVRLHAWTQGTTATVEVVTTFVLQKRRAEQVLAEAKSALAIRPGRSLRTLRELAQEFPFDKGIGGEALRLAEERERQAQADLDALEAEIGRYRVYRSPDALEQIERRAKTLTAQFLPEGTTAEDGPLEGRTAELAAQVREARAEHDRQNALPELIRLEKIATLLAEDEAYVPLAALYARAILQRFGAWAGDATDVGRRVDAARQRLEELKARPGVGAALPPEPGAGGK